LKLKFKIWFEKEGEPVLTELKYRILKEVERRGSLKEASQALGISYKKALGHLKAMEERLGYKVVDRRRGAGARLTEEGKRIKEAYEKAQRLFEELSRSLEEKEGV